MEHPDNPLLVCEGIPRFDLIKPEHIEPAVSQVLEEAEKKITELESTIEPTWSGLIKPLERLSLPFEYAWSPIGHLLNVKNSKELREEHQKMQPKVVQFSLRAGQSRPIYDGLI
ncbi:MAG TPA: M3 family peptidase, partial [Candidatus Bathyarchaeota archaeon]|nr:M3 family peptidase [Candidatus Bathyarchaeota archaeon]